MNIYLLVRILGGNKTISIAVNSDVLRGLLAMREAAIHLGGGVSRTRRVQVTLHRDKELYTRIGRSKVLEAQPEGGTDTEAIIYADAEKGALAFQTVDGRGKDSKRGPNTVMLDEADLTAALAFALRVEAKAAREETAEQ